MLDAVKKHPDAWPFVDPVQESFAPAYYDIIQSPMDISTVEVKVQEEMYRSKAKVGTYPWKSILCPFLPLVPFTQYHLISSQTPPPQLQINQ